MQVWRYRREAEEAVEILGGARADLFGGQVAELADLAGDFGNKRGFVTLAAMRDGREVGRVGLDQHAVEGDDLRGVANGLRLGKRDVAGEGNHEAEIECAARMIDAAGEAVEDAAERAGTPVRGDHLEAVVPGVFAVVGGAAVDDDRQLRSFCQLHLLQENRFLRFTGRVVVKIVEADFSPGNDLGMARPFEHLGIGGFVGEAGFVGMNADGGPDAGIVRIAIVFFHELNGAVGGRGAVAVADGEIGFDAGLFGAREDGFAIAVVALAFEMGVRVDQHGSLVSLPSSFFV